MAHAKNASLASLLERMAFTPTSSKVRSCFKPFFGSATYLLDAHLSGKGTERLKTITWRTRGVNAAFDNYFSWAASLSHEACSRRAESDHGRNVPFARSTRRPVQLPFAP